MSDQTAKPHVETSAPSTVAEILHEVDPMDNLGQFAIDDGDDDLTGLRRQHAVDEQDITIPDAGVEHGVHCLWRCNRASG